jgi:Secretion system C-terminal sorting domain
MNKIYILFFIIIGLVNLSAQSYKGKINLTSTGYSKIHASSDSLKILAVMVEFQTDTDPNTYGTGKFGSIYSHSYADTILDPLPFDINYFSNHLEFAKNYFWKVSGNKLNITYNILPQVITVSQTMRHYSPEANSTDLTNEGKFAEEVWQLAVAAYPNIDFSKYNLFTIFHAGVGREFSVPGSLGTEVDLSSVYLGINSLQKIFGSNFNGFAANGNFQITNTMILPCTESREIQSQGVTTLLQLTTNGLIVSNIASYLGLPDLFNTSTGTTAISRFGLMDPDAIFSYSGIFPPEPSAWEKIYLGWAQPVTLSVKDTKVDLAAQLAASLSDPTILKIPINSSEYFLFENRQRDVNKDGINITYKVNGKTNLFKLDKDKGRFQWYGVDTLKGVITDVDDFDWAVPGNGILIWHIDENIINAKLASDQINADLNHKGVSLVEADGIEDIGQVFRQITGELAYGSGEETDMWYAGNTGHYFINKFSNDTKPNSNSNSGANSFITIQNFSAQANKMSFNVSFENGSTSLIANFKLPHNPGEGIDIIPLFGFDKPNYFTLQGNALNRFESDGTFIKGYTPSAAFSYLTAASINYNGRQIIIGSPGFIGSPGNTINIYDKDVSTSAMYNSNNDSLRTISIPYSISTPIVIYKKNGELYITAGTNEGYILQASLNNILSTGKILQSAFQKVSNDAIVQIYRPFDDNSDYYSYITATGIFDNAQLQLQLPIKNSYGEMGVNVLTKDIDGQFINILMFGYTSGYQFNIIKGGKIINKFIVKNIEQNFSVADLLKNGANYIICSDGNSIKVLNYDGSMAEHFPFKEPNGDIFIDVFLAIDFNNDGITEIIATTGKGNIYAINPLTGKIVDGFPLTGGNDNYWLLLFDQEINVNGSAVHYKPYLTSLNLDGQLMTWNLSQERGNSYWSGPVGNSMNNAFVPAPQSINKISDFFPLNRAYNWPNPVYGGDTKIRYYVNESSNINIKIFDLAGGLVAELNDQAIGGFDHETTWNVSNVQSGIYYAHIQVNAQSGKSASKNIKIAVIK